METIDFMCHCKSCEERTSEFYLMETTCYNCGHVFLSKHRKGDKVTGGTCPYCGHHGFKWDFSFKHPAKKVSKKRTDV